MSAESFYSFQPLLEKYLRERSPKRILEWGPGMSTAIMLELAPIAEIVSIEDDEQWFLHWFNQFYGKDKLKLYLLKLDGNYVEAPLAMGKFDLVFVDGKDDYRARCLETAAQVLNAEGVVLVHDAERTYYWPPIREFFAVLETHNAQWGSQTVALELKKHDGVSVSSLEIAGTVKT